jgi:hypothetical protein
MPKLYTSHDNFEINLFEGISTVKSCFEKIEHDLTFYLSKISVGPSNWELVAPSVGFEIQSATTGSGTTLTPAISEGGGIIRYSYDLSNYIDANKTVCLKLKYNTKLEVEVISSKWFNKTYQMILSRSFGALCKRFRMRVIIENKFFATAHSVPRITFKKDNYYEFDNIPSYQSKNIALIVTLRTKKLLVVFSYVATALSGVYVPKLFDPFINLLIGILCKISH